MNRPSLSREGALYKKLRGARGSAVRRVKRLGGVDPTASIHHSARVPRDIVAHQHAFIGPECYLAPMVTLGACSMLAPRVGIVGDDHIVTIPGTPIQFTGRPEQQATRIGRDVWVGYGAILSRGITIGDGAIVGAGSVVTKDIPAYEVWVGVPARKIRDRFDEADKLVHTRALDAGDFKPTFAQPQPEAR